MLSEHRKKKKKKTDFLVFRPWALPWPARLGKGFAPTGPIPVYIKGRVRTTKARPDPALWQPYSFEWVRPIPNIWRNYSLWVARGSTDNRFGPLTQSMGDMGTISRIMLKLLMSLIVAANDTLQNNFFLKFVLSKICSFFFSILCY